MNLLLEFAEWLYSNNFPVTDAQIQTQLAIDILLSSGLDTSQSTSNHGNPIKITPTDSIHVVNVNLDVQNLMYFHSTTVLLYMFNQVQGLCIWCGLVYV